MKHFVSCSFGKDSLATVLLALEHNEPLDGVLFTEIMFDHKRGISGESPEHIEWIKNIAVPKLKTLGVTTHILHAERDYMYYFTHAIRGGGGGQHIGKLYGFPLGGQCTIQRDCKLKPIRDFINALNEPITFYIGIATDEPTRLSRLKENQISLLAKYGYSEKMAFELCQSHGLLSPVYETSSRNGCWFCPNCSIKTFALFRMKHPDLWSELEALSHTPNLCSYGFKYGKTVQEVTKKMDKYIFDLSLPSLFDEL